MRLGQMPHRTSCEHSYRSARSRVVEAWARILWGVALGAVIWASLLSGPKCEQLQSLVPFVDDKALHFLAYFGLALLAMIGFPRRGLRVALLMLVLGALLELSQLGVAGRTADTTDQLANSGGVLAGMAAGRVRRRFLPES